MEKLTNHMDNYGILNVLNPFQADVHFLYLLKTSGNLWVSHVFMGYGKRILAWDGLKE